MKASLVGGLLVVGTILAVVFLVDGEGTASDDTSTPPTSNPVRPTSSQSGDTGASKKEPSPIGIVRFRANGGNAGERTPDEPTVGSLDADTRLTQTDRNQIRLAARLCGERAEAIMALVDSEEELQLLKKTAQDVWTKHHDVDRKVGEAADPIVEQKLQDGLYETVDITQQPAALLRRSGEYKAIIHGSDLPISKRRIVKVFPGESPKLDDAWYEQSVVTRGNVEAIRTVLRLIKPQNQ